MILCPLPIEGTMLTSACPAARCGRRATLAPTRLRTTATTSLGARPAQGVLRLEHLQLVQRLDYLLTKYCTTADYGYNGFVDGKTELGSRGRCRLCQLGATLAPHPVQAEFEELIEVLHLRSGMTQNGMYGRLPHRSQREQHFPACRRVSPRYVALQ